MLFHDAARPLVDQRIIADCVAALADAQALGVVVPTADTIVEVAGGVMTSIPPRESLGRCQTPQGFRLSVIRRAHELAAGGSARGHVHAHRRLRHRAALPARRAGRGRPRQRAQPEDHLPGRPADRRAAARRDRTQPSPMAAEVPSRSRHVGRPRGRRAALSGCCPSAASPPRAADPLTRRRELVRNPAPQHRCMVASTAGSQASARPLSRPSVPALAVTTSSADHVGKRNHQAGGEQPLPPGAGAIGQARHSGEPGERPDQQHDQRSRRRQVAQVDRARMVPRDSAPPPAVQEVLARRAP